jgi:GAF domain-containing protein
MSRAAQTIASEIVLEKVLDQLMRIVLSNAGAQRGVLLLSRDGRLTIDATVTVEPDRVMVGPPVAVEASVDLPLSIVHYVERTRDAVILGDASHASRFMADPYIAAHPTKSILCLAMMHRGKLTGILYLENNAATDVFTPSRVELCSILSSQAAIAIENAWLVARTQAASDELRRANDALEDGIARRTDELHEANERLVLELRERERAESERRMYQEEVIQAQTARLSEMSTPLIPITDRIMVMPLIGVMDATRAQQMLATALEGAQKSGASVVILDITGVRDIDAQVARTFVSTATALRLLGAQTVLTGIRPEVAQALIQLDVNLGTIVTRGNLQSGIAFALSRSGEARHT